MMCPLNLILYSIVGYIPAHNNPKITYQGQEGGATLKKHACNRSGKDSSFRLHSKPATEWDWRS